MDGIQFFRQHYTLYRGGLDRQLLTQVPEEQLRLRPIGGVNSIAWVVWHAARTEDLFISRMVAGAPQLLEAERWQDRLGFALRSIGNGMSDDEVTGFGDAATTSEVIAYWRAVGERTLAVADGLRPEDLDPVPAWETVREELVRSGGFGEDPTRVDGMRWLYADRPRGWWLSHILTHNAAHYGEATTIRSLLGTRSP